MSSEIEFDEDKFGASMPQQSGANDTSIAANSPRYSSTEPGMVKWLMRNGLAKSVKTANTILLSVVIISLIVVFILISYFLR